LDPFGREQISDPGWPRIRASAISSYNRQRPPSTQVIARRPDGYCCDLARSSCWRCELAGRMWRTFLRGRYGRRIVLRPAYRVGNCPCRRSPQLLAMTKNLAKVASCARDDVIGTASQNIRLILSRRLNLGEQSIRLSTPVLVLRIVRSQSIPFGVAVLRGKGRRRTRYPYARDRWHPLPAIGCCPKPAS